MSGNIQPYQGTVLFVFVKNFLYIGIFLQDFPLVDTSSLVTPAPEFSLLGILDATFVSSSSFKLAVSYSSIISSLLSVSSLSLVIPSTLLVFVISLSSLSVMFPTSSGTSPSIFLFSSSSWYFSFLYISISYSL